MPKGKYVIKNPSISIDGTDLTKRISSLTIETTDDEVDLSSFGSGYKETGKGLADASMGFTVFHDFAESQVHATLWPLKNNDEKFIVIVKPEAGEASAENPAFMMAGELFGYNPFGGAVGEASQTEPSIKNASDLGLLVAEKKEDEETYKTELEAAIA